MSLPERWDIFCHVIDNYGDIGVCWRLARQLATEHGQSIQVRLWIDHLNSLQALCPEVNATREEQIIQGICVRHWPAQFPAIEAAETAEVVIEAFACELPNTYLTAMSARSRKPVWVNLEYLSAEKWIEECHGLASPHPSLQLTKYFFFPGFTNKTGGLLREAQLFERRDAWQADTLQARNYWGLPPSAPDELLVSLFCYENPALPALLQAWNNAPHPVRCMVPQGKALTQVLTCIDNRPLKNLSIHPLPFVRQEEYDLLLWTCDLNFVRGEDSFVRALWAGRPLVWQIYPQAEDAHLIKLDAFLEHYDNVRPESSLPTPPRNDLWQYWNGDKPSSIDAAWHRYTQDNEEQVRHARQWSKTLAEQIDLTSNLVAFCRKLL